MLPFFVLDLAGSDVTSTGKEKLLTAETKRLKFIHSFQNFTVWPVHAIPLVLMSSNHYSFKFLWQLQVFVVCSCTMHVYHTNVHTLQMQRHKSLDWSIHKINLDKTLKTGLVQV